jgi:hypothetical protein
MRYLMYSTDAPSATPPSPEEMAAIGKFMDDVKRAGVLVATGGLGPFGTRIRNTSGKLTVTDGPFTEGKEIVGGFGLIECKTKDEAIEWGKRFRSIVGDGESVVQEVFGG